MVSDTQFMMGGKGSDGKTNYVHERIKESLQIVACGQSSLRAFGK